MSMFCRQCEQTFRWQACETKGVCGKTPEVSALQDILIYVLKGLAIVGAKAREMNIVKKPIDYLYLEGIFATLTNVNFDERSLYEMIQASVNARETLKKLIKESDASAHQADFPDLVEWQPDAQIIDLISLSVELHLSDMQLDDDRRSLSEVLLYGIKGTAAYAHHAWRLGQSDEIVLSFLYKGLAALADSTISQDDLLGLVMECGHVNLKCMEILDRGHTSLFGHPEPTQVKLGTQKGKAIVVSGHELKDLSDLLEQTKDKGIKIYTHGEMLPALSYPGFKKYSHLVGHYGTAWQNQQKEFDNLPAAILMTTNCIQEPAMTYEDRLFTTGAVAWSGVAHIPEKAGKKDFSAVIEKALALPGFQEDNIEKEITIGFGHQTVLGAAEQIVEAVKAGDIKRFYLIGGCDGARPGRNYYSKFAESVPDDCLILTLACGKNRINRLDYPTVAGFPKLLDMGQCNDAYSAIVVAQALAQAFECDVNELPISFILSWYEQKAVAILLTLFALGVKNIKLGPSLPAFVSPHVLNILVEKFQIQPIKTVSEDLAETLAN